MVMPRVSATNTANIEMVSVEWGVVLGDLDGSLGQTVITCRPPSMSARSSRRAGRWPGRRAWHNSAMRKVDTNCSTPKISPTVMWPTTWMFMKPRA